jgi:hypothetical protein
MPGNYKVTMAKRVDGVVTPLPGEQEFRVYLLGPGGARETGLNVLHEFQGKVSRLQRAVAAASEMANSLTDRLEQIKRALDHTPVAESKWKDMARTLEKRNRDIIRVLRGDTILRRRNENTPLSISERVGTIVGDLRTTTSGPTRTQQDSYQVASEEFSSELAKLRTLIEVDLKTLEKALDAMGAPYTPGRLPEWRDR